jgi:serine/threonine protein kinase
VAVDLTGLAVAKIDEGPTGIKHWSGPETRSQSTYDQKTDTWSYGCLVCFIFSGINPFYNDPPAD